MSNSVTIRTSAPGAKQAAADIGFLKKSIVGVGSKANGPLGGLLGGLGAISGPALLAGAGIGLLGKNLLDGMAGALEESKQLARLDTALDNNVRHTDGARDAFDNATESAMDFAFADDDTRESLIKLLPATRNAGNAIDDMHLAMDIARGRGIDLAAATDIVVKAEMGNTTALRRMGIAVDKGATSYEILAKLEKTYAGQAMTYANTEAGQIEAKQIRVNEAFEDFGGILNDVMFAVVDTADELTSINYSKNVASFDPLEARIGGLRNIFNSLKGPGGLAGGGLSESISDNIGAALKKAGEEAGPKAEKLGRDLSQDINESFVDDIHANKGVVADAMKDLMFAIHNPLAAARERTRIEAALHGKAIVDGLKSTNPDIRAAAQAAQQILMEQLRQLTPMAADAGANAGTAYSRAFARNFSINIPGNPFGKGSKPLGGNDERGKPKPKKKTGGKVAGSHAGDRGMATGGPVRPGEAYTVGENGPEQLVMGNQGGYIIPHGRGSRGGSTNIHISLSTREFSHHSAHFATIQRGGPSFT